MLGVFLDVETNGLNPAKHRTLEVAFSLINLQTGSELSHYHRVVSQSERVWEQSNSRSLEVNGFTFEMVQKGAPEEQVQKEVLTLFEQFKVIRKQAIFICQNPSFDRVFFSQIIDPDEQEMRNWPYHWLDLASMFYALEIKRAQLEKNEGFWAGDIALSKDQIAMSHGLAPEPKPHGAVLGVRHLIDCYEAVVGWQ